MDRKDLMGCRHVNARAIAGFIHEKGLKQWWVAYQAGIYPSTLRRWTNGSVKQAELWRLVNLSVALDVPLEAICDVRGKK